MDPQELWWLADAHRPPKKYGSLSEPEVAELYEFLKDYDEGDVG